MPQRIVVLIAIAAVGFGHDRCTAQDGGNAGRANSPRHQEWVNLPAANERSLRTFVVYPEVNKAVHAVVIVHENRGLTPWEQELADQVAAAGFVAVVPDLLSAMGPDKGASDSFESAATAREAIHNLKPGQILADLDEVVKYAGNLTAVDHKVAVAGFCWGGGQAFRYAAHNPQIAAALVFYGSAPADELLKQLTVPVYGFYGENDFRITGEVPKLKARLKTLDKAFQPITYAGAGHGFVRGRGPGRQTRGPQGARAGLGAIRGHRLKTVTLRPGCGGLGGFLTRAQRHCA